MHFVVGAKQVVVIAGPAGSGKNAVLMGVLSKCSKCVRLVTATTRAPREGERDGIDYHFVTVEKFENALRNGDILEHRFVPSLGTHYGVYKPELDRHLANGEVMIAQIDIVGARYMKANYNATTIFIMPDSFETLEKRIRTRDPGITDEEIKTRMDIARTEVEDHSLEYDYRVINKEGRLDATIDKVMMILTNEGFKLGQKYSGTTRAS